MKTELDFWKIGHQKFISRSRGEKFYRASFEFRGIERYLRRPLRRASDAVAYGVAVRERYKRLLGVMSEEESV